MFRMHAMTPSNHHVFWFHLFSSLAPLLPVGAVHLLHQLNFVFVRSAGQQRSAVLVQGYRGTYGHTAIRPYGHPLAGDPSGPGLSHPLLVVLGQDIHRETTRPVLEKGSTLNHPLGVLFYFDV